jgi:hypothetical protein
MTSKYSPIQSLSLIRKTKVVKWICLQRVVVYTNAYILCSQIFLIRELKYSIFLSPPLWAFKKFSFYDFMDYLMMKLTIIVFIRSLLKLNFFLPLYFKSLND